MVESGAADHRRKVDITYVQIYISADSGNASLTCVLPHRAVGPVEGICVAGIPERIALGNVVSQILIQEIFVAVEHGEVAFCLDPVTEAFNELLCKFGRDRDALAGGIVNTCLLDVIADGIFQFIVRDRIQTSVGLLNCGRGAHGIAEPVRADGKPDAVAFGGVSAELGIHCVEAVSGAEHGELVPGSFHPFPVHLSLKFADIKSFYTHRKHPFRILRRNASRKALKL